MPFISLISAVFFIVSNYFPSIFAWWRQISEISWNLLITPASYAFTIWFPIFIGCIAFAISSFFTKYTSALHFRLSLVFILLWIRTTVVSFTDIFRLPPLLFIIASITLLNVRETLHLEKELHTWRKYKAIVIPLYMFIWRSNSAYILNIWTAINDYTNEINQIWLGTTLIICLALWHYYTTFSYKLPIATISTYIWATIAIAVALIIQNITWILLRITIAHSLWLMWLIIKNILKGNKYNW